MRKHIILLLVVCLHLAARGQTIEGLDLSGLPQPTQAKALRYWFDEDAGSMQTISQLTGTQSLDVSSLMEGLHTLHYQVIDTEGHAAYVRSGLFLKVEHHSESLSTKSMRYWFDDDAGNVQTASGTTGTYLLNVSQLIEGLHTLHYQLIDVSNTTAYISSAIFLKMDTKVNSTQAKSMRYWFDDKTASTESLLSGGVRSIDASALLDGLHTIHYQVVGDDGKDYYVASALFLKTGNSFGAETATAKKLMYWFDDDTTIQFMDIGDGVQVLDASGLINGLHTLHYQVLCDKGQMTPAMSSLFLRMSIDEETTVAKSLRYWFDDEQTAVEVDVTEGVQMLDASRLIEGLHTVHYQIANSNGTLGTPASAVFLKMDTSASSVAKSLRYWFDDDVSTARVTDVANGTQTLDVSTLLTGLHTLNYQLIDSNNKLGVPVTRVFFKNFDRTLADGHNRVTKYQYWLNMNSQAMQTVEVDAAANPYTLIALLPMQKEPIQSSLFHFEATDGVPTIYAKNTLHVRFYDAQNYFIDGDKPFVDYSVKQEVTDVEWLESGVRATTDKPTENAIKWYCLEAEPGDSLQFKLDRAATIQLFAPSGEELFSTSGAESVKWGGLHVSETGTYYLALHDVTAQQGTTVSIDYNHIDKYAVLRQDVAVVGNGGCSTITFEGNGFRDLYAVDLYNAQGDTIKHVYIGHESDATTSVAFDFTDAALDTYHAKFRFAGEDKVFKNLVTVEMARDIELATTVTYPSTFLRGTSTTYTIKITNKGNMTAYAVPIYTYIRNHDISGITHIEYEGVEFGPLYPQDVLDSLSESEQEQLRDLEKRLGADPYFLKRMVPDGDNIGDSVVIRTNYTGITIAPYSTKVLNITITSTENVEVWITTPSEWITYNEEIVSNSRQLARRAIIQDYYCCYKEHVECFLEGVSGALDILAPVVSIASRFLGPEAALLGGVAALEISLAGCLTSIGNDMLKTFGATLCSSEKENGWNRLKDALIAANRAKLSFGSKISCIGAVLSAFGIPKSAIKSCIEAAGYTLSSVAIGNDLLNPDTSCKKSEEKKPNCPPNSGGGGGTSTPVNSYDPNEIYGYTAESGSKAVKDELTEVYYTIQFENDTTFATSAAHEIVVTDTLDATKFDLSTFEPTRIKIGEKSAELTGDKNFVTTVDMRPEINAIAQVEGTFDQSKGIAKWHITSLDPMTMEPTDDPMDGVLPINTNGNGIGEVSYNISLKPDLAHGTKVNNRAGIVFDQNDVIMTPTWTNIIDRIAPASRVDDVEVLNDSTAAVSIVATDELSDPWRYDVYVQYGEGSAWWKAAENIPVDPVARVKIYDGIDHGFYVVATDSAGNVERKEAEREYSLRLSDRIRGDVNGDGQVGIADIVAVTSYMVKTDESITLKDADVNGDGQVGIADIIAITDIMAGTANARANNKNMYKTYFIRNRRQ